MQNQFTEVDRSNATVRGPRIRGRRWLLFNVDLKREIAHPLCMGLSRDWLMLLAHLLNYPAVVEIGADEANSIARRGVVPIDNATIAELARQCRSSKRHMAGTIKAMLREEEAARRARRAGDESRNLVPGGSGRRG